MDTGIALALCCLVFMSGVASEGGGIYQLEVSCPLGGRCPFEIFSSAPAASHYLPTHFISPPSLRIFIDIQNNTQRWASPKLQPSPSAASNSSLAPSFWYGYSLPLLQNLSPTCFTNTTRRASQPKQSSGKNTASRPQQTATRPSPAALPSSPPRQAW